MKKIIILFLTALTLITCQKEDNGILNPPEGDDTNAVEDSIGLVRLNVVIDVPEGSNVNSEDLKVSSLFSEDEPVLDDKSSVQLFSGEGAEAIFATNETGNIVLLNIIDPSQTDEIPLNITTTALSMVLLHPWAFDLAPRAKMDAMEYIKTLDEFPEFVSSLENAFNSGAVDPLIASEVLAKLQTIQTQIAGLNIYKEPLRLTVSGNKATISNELSSVAYGVGLYDENDEAFLHKLVEGIDKTNYEWETYLDNTLGTPPTVYTHTDFTISGEGEWTLKAKSGLSFDGSLENTAAAYRNSLEIGVQIFWLVSTRFGNLFFEEDCLAEAGNIFFGHFKTVLQGYADGDLTSHEMIESIQSIMANLPSNIINLVDNCVSGIKEKPLKKLLSYVEKLNILADAYNLSSIFVDWEEFDREIEFCLKVDCDGNIRECPVVGVFINYVADICLEGDDEGVTFSLVSGGTAPYQFSVNCSPFQTDSLVKTSIDQGDQVFIRVKDANGEIKEETVTAPICSDPQNQISFTADFGIANNAVIFENIQGGTPPRRFSVNGSPFSDSPVVIPGFQISNGMELNLKVRDKNGCEGEQNVIVSDDQQVCPTIVVSGAYCAYETIMDNLNGEYNYSGDYNGRPEYWNTDQTVRISYGSDSGVPNSWVMVATGITTIGGTPFGTIYVNDNSSSEVVPESGWELVIPTWVSSYGCNAAASVNCQ